MIAVLLLLLLVLILQVLLAASGGSKSCDAYETRRSGGSRCPDTRTAAAHDDDDDYRSVVDIGLYPIHNLDGEPCQRIIRAAREKWLELGAVDLPDFVRADVRARMAAEVAPEAGLLAKRRLYTAPYLAQSLITSEAKAHQPSDASHPLSRQFQTDIHAIAADQVPPSTLLRKLYESRTVQKFLARIIGKAELFQYDDVFQSLNIMYQHDAGQRSWHYDGSDFVTTVLVQKSDEGGEFEFAPFIRGPLQGDRFDERFDAVRALFDGHYEGTLLKSNREAGSLQLFNGQRSLHRVRAAYGPTTRITAVLSYDTKPPCAQSTPSLGANVRNYGERVRDSSLWRESQQARQRACAAAGVDMPPKFETEG